jgi:phosphatidylethanolamine-binding protein (PEBP) family uncharacterized protein
MALALLALAALGGSLLAGCGGGKSAATSTFATPGTAGSHPVSAGEVVAYVSGTPISKASYEHWLTVERSTGGAAKASHRALGFLLTASWVLGEAQARHISLSESEATQHLEKLIHQSFPKSGQLEKFLTKAHESRGDLLARVKVELLTTRIASQVTVGQSPETKRKATLASFERRFQAHWRALTTCLPAYVMEDCKEYKGASEQLTAPASSRGTSSGSGSSSSNYSGEVYTAPGAFSLVSSAFERNGPVPAEYTCDGKGISPPIEWQKVPKGAAELVLFVIDLSSTRSSGGIRWVVGGIDPESHGVAAGRVPPGGIVGTNTAGKAAYGPICPAHGHSDTIELVMYALRRPIKLSPGFGPDVAESEYGPTKDILGPAATTYAVYHRA